MASGAGAREGIVVVGSNARSLVEFRGRLLEEFVRRGYRVVAAAGEFRRGERARLEEMGVRAVQLPLERLGTDPIADFRFSLSLRRLFLRERPAITLCYTPKPIAYGALAWRSFGHGRLFVMITGLGRLFTGCLRWKEVVARECLKILLRHAAAVSSQVFLQNHDDLARLKAAGIVPEGKGRVTRGSGVDLEAYPPAPLPNEAVFLLLGRLIKEKGIREYVDAARILKRRYPMLRFLLAGWIEQSDGAVGEEEVQRWVREGTIEFLGALEDVRPALAEASIYVLPTYYGEGIPRSILEAMSMARPVITTDSPGCREAVLDGVNGFLVRVRDSVSLAEAMERFVVDKKLAERMGAAGRARAEAEFDVRIVNRVLLAEMGLKMGE